jgi:hypothetical protein
MVAKRDEGRGRGGYILYKQRYRLEIGIHGGSTKRWWLKAPSPSFATLVGSRTDPQEQRTVAVRQATRHPL